MTLVLCDDRKRLLATNSHVVVRGGAGSGKTTISLAKACADLATGTLGEFGKGLFLSFARATVSRVAEQATAMINREQYKRLEINTYHGFAWSIIKSHGYLLCARPGVSLLLPAMARSRLTGFEGAARLAKQRELFETEGLVAFDLFPPIASQILSASNVLAKAYGQAYPLIIVDEFQDTNAEEWEFIKCLGRHSKIVALGDPKQRIYDFKGADPKRFDDFIEAFEPEEFDFESENRRSPGTDIPKFSDDILTGAFDPLGYKGVEIKRYSGITPRALKVEVTSAAARLEDKGGDWSLAVLVPSNALAANVWDFLRARQPGLGPFFGADILVSSEGPMLAARLLCLLLEPVPDRTVLAVEILRGIASYNLGRTEKASKGAQKMAANAEKIAANTLADPAALLKTVLGRGVSSLIDHLEETKFTGAPIPDWLLARRLFDSSERDELQVIGQEVRHMRLLQRGAQIEGRLADAWRAHGSYRDARQLLDAAVVEDQFVATTRPMNGVTVMTIHKAKGKEFDEVIVYEGAFVRYLRGASSEQVRSARFNLLVAATRAKSRVQIWTPIKDPCPLLP